MPSWTEIAQYLVQEGIDYLLGCASISMLDGGYKAWRITQQVQQEHLAADNFRVTPKRTLPHLASHRAQTDKWRFRRCPRDTGLGPGSGGVHTGFP